jgi:hypothetical protein
VVIRGTGFARGVPAGNTIDFAGMMITSVASNATGTEIRFTVPLRLVTGTEARSRAVTVGAYNVRVSNAAGASNTVILRVVQ